MKVPVQAGANVAIETPSAELSPGDGATQLIDLLPVMAWTATRDGKVDFVNQQWCAFTGLPRDQLLTGGMVEVLHPDDRGVRQQILAMVAEQRAFEYEVRVQRYDGEYRRCLARAVPARDNTGQVVKWVGTTTDIEDMRRTTDQMKLQEEHYQLALESADIGIWRIKVPTMELTVDDRTRRHLDLDRNVIVGYNPETRIHPEDFRRAGENQTPLGNDRYVTEHRVIQHDGTYRWQAVHWRVYLDGESTPALFTGTSMDVTSRKQAEAEREELGLRYRMALDVAELGTWNYDIQQGQYHMDARARTHYGVDQPVLTSEQFVACIHETDREQVLEEVRRKLREPENTGRATADYRVRHPNGELRWLSVQVKLIFADDGGRAVRLIGVTRDITEMKLTEMKLRESEARLRRFAEHIDDALWVGDPHTKMPVYVSPAFERMGGRALMNEANDPDNWLHSIHPDDRKSLEHLTETRFHSGFTIEFRIVRPDGSIMWARNRTFPIYDDRGELIHVGGIIEDITQRKQFEESLRSERERFDRLVSVAPGVLFSYRWISPGVGQHIYIGPALADFHGVTPEEIARDPMSVFRWVPPEDALRVRQSLEESIQTGTEWLVDYRVWHPSKGLLWLSTTAVPVNEADGAATVHGFLVDITARKQAEEQVLRLNTSLELRVQQRTAELTAANQELESFAYAVSHDLRAPLRAMWGFCDALIEDYGPALPPEAREYLQHVIDGSRHLGEIIDGLLALSRSTRGNLRRDAVDLSGLAEKILRDMARIEPDRCVTWAIQPALRASGDSRMIDAVMRNLLGNAWKYTANRNDAAIRLYSDTVDGEYVFCVEDNGAGFNMEHAEKLFQPFQRLHRQDEFNGLGIGLATVQRIIHRHGGKVCGTGAPGKGALFRFSLPVLGDVVADNTEQERD